MKIILFKDYKIISRNKEYYVLDCMDRAANYKRYFLYKSETVENCKLWINRQKIMVKRCIIHYENIPLDTVGDEY